ncbi:MAG: hypothetical protein AABO58_01145 [Acidobacteriota bacterium]
MLVLEALRAKFGDSLLLHYGDANDPKLIVIDGGPPGVWNDTLRPRLEALRAERGLAPEQPLEIELVMVSHIDADHITGLIEMMRKQKDLRDGKKPLPYRVKRFWHNSFDDIIGPASGASLGGSASLTASAGEVLAASNSAEGASVGQGRDLRKLIDAFSLDGNKPFGGMATLDAKNNPATLAGMKLTVVGPAQDKLDALQKEWDKELKAILAKEKAKTDAAAFIDNSVPNLASIIVFVEFDGKRILLTGDGRGDHTLEGLEKRGFMTPGGKIDVDILKVPHHGSVRDVAAEYFERIRTPRYVISADGKFDNPDLATLKLISAARPDDAFTIYMTNPTDEFVKPEVGSAIAAFFDAEKKKGRKYKVVQRKADETSVRIDLS